MDPLGRTRHPPAGAVDLHSNIDRCRADIMTDTSAMSPRTDIDRANSRTGTRIGTHRMSADRNTTSRGTTRTVTREVNRMEDSADLEVKGTQA